MKSASAANGFAGFRSDAAFERFVAQKGQGIRLDIVADLLDAHIGRDELLFVRRIDAVETRVGRRGA